MALKPETIISGIRIGAAMTAAGMQPEEIASRSLAIGILLDQRDPELATRLLAQYPRHELELLQPLINGIVEARDAV